jgi:hypothetical protein
MIMQVLFIFLPGSFVIVIQVNADVYFVPERGPSTPLDYTWGKGSELALYLVRG